MIGIAISHDHISNRYRSFLFLVVLYIIDLDVSFWGYPPLLFAPRPLECPEGYASLFTFLRGSPVGKAAFLLTRFGISLENPFSKLGSICNNVRFWNIKSCQEFL